MDPAVTLGIDLAAQPERTAVCALRWGPSQASAATLLLGADDDLLSALRADAGTVGIDAPFGWPRDYAHALARWRAERAWPQPDPASREGSALLLRTRASDRHVRERTGITPLSPSSDRIAVCAWRCAGLLSRWGVRDLGGGEGVAEVYPAAALKLWGLPHRGYKAGAPSARAAARSVRERMLASLRQALPGLTLSGGQWEACAREHDLLDALVCALVARAVAIGATERPAGEARALAREEGWIHLPECPPVELA